MVPEDAEGREFVRELESDSRNGPCALLEHERVWFRSFAYEWPPEMLYAAARLTVDVAASALKEGFSLKDATPFNVLFRGPKPVFVGVLSFEKRDPNDSRWLPYAQFVRTLVLPLLSAKQLSTRGDEIFLSSAEGLKPEDLYCRLTWFQRMRPPFLSTVSLPTWLAKRVDPDDKKLYAPDHSGSPEKANFVLEIRFRQARKLLETVKPHEERTSAWSSYPKEFSYSSQEFDSKSELVRKWVADAKAQTVLDVGCNTGHFSEIAARGGAKVVAIDLDPVVVGQTWCRANAADLDILPLVVNLARPTPAMGWRNSEYPSFLDRAAGSFDMVLMLAVLHHLLVTERIPLREILEVCAELTTGYLVIEYVSKDDRLFQRLTRGRESLHADFSQEGFEGACQEHFMLMEKHPLKDTRWLYLLKRRRS
ncbi:MAG: methyltransferase domain-containing protein [Acidobacteriaceae bacterium]|nr:methyltransferase domain-containing protein [Acidobacteriaceae bacterium]